MLEQASRLLGHGARLIEQSRVPLPNQFHHPDPQFWYVDNHFDPEFLHPGTANLAANYDAKYAMNPTRYSCIDCLIYDGVDNFRSWKCRCEQIFEVQQVPKFLKIRTVYFSFVGDALEWHHSFMEDKRGMMVSWEMYTYHMRLRFNKNQLGSPTQ